MIWIWFLPSLLTLSLVIVFFPLFSKNGNRPLPIGLESDPKTEWLYEKNRLLRQLRELDLENNPDDPDLMALRGVLENRLAQIFGQLETSGSGGAVTLAVTPSAFPHWAVGIAIIAVVILTTSGLYLVMGTPQDIPPATEQPHQTSNADMDVLLTRLAKRLQSEPDNLPGWLQLARSYAVLGRTKDAIAIFDQIRSRHPDEVDANAGLAELYIQSEDPEKVRMGFKLFAEIHAKNPERQDALWFLGAASFQSGEREQALKYWKKLLALLPDEAPSRATVEKAIAQAENP